MHRLAPQPPQGPTGVTTTRLPAAFAHRLGGRCPRYHVSPPPAPLASPQAMRRYWPITIRLVASPFVAGMPSQALSFAELGVVRYGEIMLNRFRVVSLVLTSALFASQAAHAQTAQLPPEVHIVYMGGNDCPPCVDWRRFELPKLEKSPEFAPIRFSFVIKAVASPIPPTFFLPREVRPYKEKLDYASSGRRGSPQTAILVNGEIFDYFQGTRTAEEFERMLAAIRTGGAYPFERCVKASAEWLKCEKRG